jgi:hypothetical protein
MGRNEESTRRRPTDLRVGDGIPDSGYRIENGGRSGRGQRLGSAFLALGGGRGPLIPRPRVETGGPLFGPEV